MWCEHLGILPSTPATWFYIFTNTNEGIVDGNDTCVLMNVPNFAQLSLCKYLSQPASWTKALALYICGKWYLGNIQVKKEGSF